MNNDVDVNRVINLFVIKNTWKIFHGSLEKSKNEISEPLNFYEKIVGRYNYQKALRGEAFKYKKNINDIGLSKEILEGKTLIIENDDNFKGVYSKIKTYISNQGLGNRKIQSYETKMRTYIKQEKESFMKRPTRYSNSELRKLFIYFSEGRKLIPEREILLLNEIINNVTIKTLVNNIHNMDLLQEHRDEVESYLKKLDAFILLNEDLKNIFSKL